MVSQLKSFAHIHFCNDPCIISVFLFFLFIFIFFIDRLEQGLESDLFLLQCCAALAPPDSFVQRVLERYGLLNYMSLNLSDFNEYVSIFHLLFSYHIVHMVFCSYFHANMHSIIYD